MKITKLKNDLISVKYGQAHQVCHSKVLIIMPFKRKSLYVLKLSLFDLLIKYVHICDTVTSQPCGVMTRVPVHHLILQNPATRP